MEFLIVFINILAQVLVLLIIAGAILSFFMSPYHPIRQTIDKILNPMLAPIRRVVPLVGMMDFSPLILVILVQVVASVLTRILYMVR